MEYKEIIDASIIVFFVYVIQMVYGIVVWGLILKLIMDAFRRNKSRRYFKNNVVRTNNNITSINNKKMIKTYIDIHKSKLAKFNTDDIDTLKDYFYNKFLQFEVAYNNLDLNMMKLLSTKQLFYNYQTGINLDLKVGKKRIINNIERKKVILFELDSTIAKQVATAMIEISYINYTINKQGIVTSGSRTEKVTEKFEVGFRKEFERKEITKCPNCGASISGNRCEYCRTIIHNVDFKISSIKKIID